MLSRLESLTSRGLPGLLRVRMQCAPYSAEDFEAALRIVDRDDARELARVLCSEARRDLGRRALTRALRVAVTFGLPAAEQLVQKIAGRGPAGGTPGRDDPWARSSVALPILLTACVFRREAIARAVTAACPGLIPALDPWADDGRWPACPEASSEFVLERFRAAGGRCAPWVYWGLGLPWLHARSAELGAPEPWPRARVAEWRRRLGRSPPMSPGLRRVRELFGRPPDPRAWRLAAGPREGPGTDPVTELLDWLEGLACGAAPPVEFLPA